MIFYSSELFFLRNIHVLFSELIFKNVNSFHANVLTTNMWEITPIFKHLKNSKHSSNLVR